MMVGENLVLFASFRLPRSVCSASSSVGPDDFLSTCMVHEPGQPASLPAIGICCYWEGFAGEDARKGW
jgi:hypothetical protein